MGEKTDQAKGRIKEAIGTVTGDEGLEREGRDDRLAGEANEKIGDAKDKVVEVVDKAKEKLGEAKDKVDEVIDKTRETVHRK